MMEKFAFNNERKENILTPREKLLALEKEGRFVFHGSRENIEILEPRQAYNYQEKDGAPAVFATPYADVAIYRALINANNINGKSSNSFGINKNRLFFKTSANLLEAAKHITGNVYVLDKNMFTEFQGTECRSNHEIQPMQVIRVYAEDLPSNIEIINI